MKLQECERVPSMVLHWRILKKMTIGEVYNSSTLGSYAWPTNRMTAQACALAIGPTLNKMRSYGWLAKATGRRVGWVVRVKGKRAGRRGELRQRGAASRAMSHEFRLNKRARTIELKAPGLATVDGRLWTLARGRKYCACANCGCKLEPGDKTWRPFLQEGARWERICAECVK